ncbi:hypothetical protein NBRC116188_24490 [Oceaniserpentilla sp. 4NH20-0058]|uniref:DsbA family oxidoreductase n=1 Tax=Oceaniserpentilla sp. 4NH20-0058 TaxID=3127660 RepID=UPI003109AEC5
MKEPLAIQYYSDVLCVWAWIAQRRIEELKNTFGNSIEFNYHYVDIFGDVPNKMSTSWHEKGGYSGFANHVKESASQYDAVIHPDVWTKTKPTTSANSHLYIKAVELSYDSNEAINFSLLVRKYFFEQAKDISDLNVLSELAKSHCLDPQKIDEKIVNGLAMASLMSNYQMAGQKGIKGSPSYVIDGGRQTLYGNVGYRVLNANIEEMLKQPQFEASWC